MTKKIICNFCNKEIPEGRKGCLFCTRALQWDTRISLNEDSVINSYPKNIQKHIKKYHPTSFVGRAGKILDSWETEIKKDSKDSLFLFGETGTGKTVVACAVANFKLRNTYIDEGIFTPCRILYNVYDFFCILKSFYSKVPAVSEATEFQFLKKLEQQPLLIIDDLGVEKGTEWEMFMLYGLINNRAQEGLPTIYTSNYSLEELSIKMSNDRIVSRILLNSKVIRCSGFEGEEM